MGQTLAEKYVKFVAVGIDAVGDHLDRLKSKFTDASAAADRMNKFISGGVVGADKLGGSAFDANRKKMEAISATAKRMNADLAAAKWVQMATEVKTLTERNAQFAGVLSSGAYARYAQQMAAINAEYRKLQNAARLQDLIAQHGQLGGKIQHIREQYNEATRSAQIAFGVLSTAITGLVTAGTQGTVEGERLTLAWQLLSREIASVFKPVIDGFTDAIMSVVDWFQSLSGEGQQVIRTVTLLAGGILGMTVAIRIAIALFAMMSTSIAAIGLKYSHLTAAVGAFRGAMMSLYTALGPVAALTAALGVLVGLFAVLGNSKGPNLDAGELTKYLDEIDARRLQVLNDSLKAEFGDEEKQRKIRNVGAIQEAGGRSLLGKMYQPDPLYERLKKSQDEQRAILKRADEERQRQFKGEKPRDRSDVTLSQTGREDFASTYDRLTDALLKVDAADNKPNEERTADNTGATKTAVEAILAAVQQYMNQSPDKRV